LALRWRHSLALMHLDESGEINRTAEELWPFMTDLIQWRR
jgi:hypothetical protein